jgi:hypothetical protein
MTVAQYVSLTNAIKRCVALCLGPEWDFDIDDVLHLLKEQFPDVVEAARERMADLGFQAGDQEAHKEAVAARATRAALLPPSRLPDRLSVSGDLLPAGGR